MQTYFNRNSKLREAEVNKTRVSKAIRSMYNGRLTRGSINEQAHS